jgi:hypothetical protein
MPKDNVAHAIRPAEEPTNRYSVATMGFDEVECRTLRGVLAISEQHTPTFRPFVPVPHRYPHIVIVNGDDLEAVENWNRFERAGKRKNVCAVFLSHEPDSQHRRYVLARPTQAALLLTLLAHVVAENYGVLPDPGKVRRPLILLQ